MHWYWNTFYEKISSNLNFAIRLNRSQLSVSWTNKDEGYKLIEPLIKESNKKREDEREVDIYFKWFEEGQL